MLTIKVKSPNEKIITGIQGVSLDQIYLQNEFRIEVEKRQQTLKFEINLPEWLLSLTDFIKVQGDTDYDVQLLLSGEHFIAKRERGISKIRIFDLIKMKIDWLQLTVAELAVLHSRLVCELIDAVEQSAGRSLHIRDLDRLNIDEVGS